MGEFENVDNKTHTFAAAYSSCAWPIDTLVSGLKGLPVMAPLKDAFDDDTCIQGSELAKTAADVPLVGTLVSGLSTDDSCYHLANGFSEGADWSLSPLFQAVLPLMARAAARVTTTSLT